MSFKKNDLKNKLLIAGGTGFIGSCLARKALDDGYRVTIILKINIYKKLKGVEYIIVDIMDKNLFTKLKNKSFNHVINLSGYVDHSKYSSGGMDVFNTHHGAINLFNSVSKKNNQFVQIGSSDEYGSNIAPQKETQREDPISPYSSAKVSITHFLQTIYKTQKFPVIILRLFLVYGGGQKNNRFIPQIINGVLNKVLFLFQLEIRLDFAILTMCQSYITFYEL